MRSLSIRGEILRGRKGLASEAHGGRLTEQLVLMVLGFLLTGVIGTWLTNQWSARQWENQQAYLARQWKNQQAYLKEQRLLDQKLQLLERVTTEIAATNVAASDVITTDVWGWNMAKRRKEIQERENRWVESSRRWRIQSRILVQDLAINFRDPEAVRLLQNIRNKRRQLGQKIRALLEARHGNGKGDNFADDGNELVNSIDSLAIQLGKVLGGEIQSREN